MSLWESQTEYCAGEPDARPDEPKLAEMQDPGVGVLSDGNRKCTTESSVINEDCLSGQHSTMESDSKLQFVSTYAHELGRPSGCNEDNKEHEQCKLRPLGLGVDLNALDTLSTVEQYPFYPFNCAGQVKSTDVSECGSTTGPVTESEPLRKWKEMKQNGFISHSPGGISMPKQRGRPPRKKKDDDLGKKVGFTRRNQAHQTKREQVNQEKARREQVKRFTKIAAPSGLLSGLNPGIINHVRNSKQVHSIIEAIVRSERNDIQTQNRTSNQLGRANKELTDRLNEQNFTNYSSVNQFSTKTGKSRPTMGFGYEKSEVDSVGPTFDQSASTSSGHTAQLEDDVLELKLSSATTLSSNDVASGSTDALLRNQDNFDSVTLKAATVASQWLELLQLDIKGRLAALRSSKKRLRNAIGTELPYLLSTEFTSNQENNPSLLHSSEDGSSSNAISEMHVARWTSLFNQMDRALSEEGKHLESWLKQVKDMQLRCENGLKYVLSDSLPLVGPSDASSKTKKSKALDMELAVQAAAASIYSTSNLVMRTENVPCF